MSKVDTSWAEAVASSVQAGASYACQICLIVHHFASQQSHLGSAHVKL